MLLFIVSYESVLKAWVFTLRRAVKSPRPKDGWVSTMSVDDEKVADLLDVGGRACGRRSCGKPRGGTIQAKDGR